MIALGFILLVLAAYLLGRAVASSGPEVAAQPPSTTVTAPPTGTTQTVPTTTPSPTKLPVTTTTGIPTTATTTTTAAALPHGLFCRDLKGRGYTYAEALAYWKAEGSPDRMDADRNGIPCETVYPAAEIAADPAAPASTTTAAAKATTDPDAERAALIALYNATGGPAWTGRRCLFPSPECHHRQQCIYRQRLHP